MKIVYVSHYYPPEMGAPAARVSAFARRWAAMGHDVTVVTTFPNHPTGIIPPEYRGHLRLIEDDHGVRVVRTFLYAAANKGVVKRGLCYVSFALSSILQGYGPAGSPDVVIATSPQFLVTPAMLEEIWKRLAARGVEIPRMTYDDSSRLVSSLLAYDIARYVFGPEAEFRRRVANDKVIGVALEMATGVKSQSALLDRAATRQKALGQPADE